jgi:hypothetical protein
LFSPGTPVSSTNKIHRHDIAEILLKVALNTINQTNQPNELVFSYIYTLFFSSADRDSMMASTT